MELIMNIVVGAEKFFDFVLAIPIVGIPFLLGTLGLVVVKLVAMAVKR